MYFETFQKINDDRYSPLDIARLYGYSEIEEFIESNRFQTVSTLLKHPYNQ